MITFKEKHLSNSPAGLTSDAVENSVLRTGYPRGRKGLRIEVHAYSTTLGPPVSPTDLEVMLFGLFSLRTCISHSAPDTYG